MGGRGSLAELWQLGRRGVPDLRRAILSGHPAILSGQMAIPSGHPAIPSGHPDFRPMTPGATLKPMSARFFAQ